MPKQVKKACSLACTLFFLDSYEKGIAEEKLEAAKPALEEAEEALNTIKPANIATGLATNAIISCFLLCVRNPPIFPSSGYVLVFFVIFNSG